MRQTTRTRKSPGEKIVKDIKRATRKHYSFEGAVRGKSLEPELAVS
ncbi:MAG: transposase [Akkermansiaceae bacterium]|jgi:transposase